MLATVNLIIYEIKLQDVLHTGVILALFFVCLFVCLRGRVSLVSPGRPGAHLVDRWNSVIRLPLPLEGCD